MNHSKLSGTWELRVFIISQDWVQNPQSFEEKKKICSSGWFTAIFFVSCSFESVVKDKAGSIFRNTLISDVSVIEFDGVKCDPCVLCLQQPSQQQIIPGNLV